MNEQTGKLAKMLFNVASIKYRIGMYVVRTPLSYQINCNQMIMINQGTTVAIVDQLTIAPGESFSIPGELFEEMDHHFNISFNGAGTSNLVCIFKEYL